MPLFVVRDFLGQLRNEVRTFRTWSYETHFTTQDAPELRNLIHADLADDATHSRSAIVSTLGPLRTSFFSVDDHRTKFHEHERLAGFTDSLLLIKNGTGRIHLNEDRRHDRDG